MRMFLEVFLSLGIGTLVPISAKHVASVTRAVEAARRFPKTS